jgi:hypothetical protein
VPLPDDQRSATKITLAYMRALVQHGKIDPWVRQTAMVLVQDLPPKNRALEIETLFEYVRDEVRYLPDPNDVEMLHWARRVLEQRAGDCDDKGVLLCSLLESIGYSTAFRAVGFKPGEFSHVYCMVKFGPGWLPLDPSVESAVVGWSPSQQTPPAQGQVMTVRNSR